MSLVSEKHIVIQIFTEEFLEDLSEHEDHTVPGDINHDIIGQYFDV